MPRRPFAGVVFDCDGVLLDTQAAWTAATDHLCRVHGLRFSGDEQDGLIGASVEQIAGSLAGQLRRPDLQANLERRLIRLLARGTRQVRPLPGARQLVEHAWRHLATAVASNGPRAVVEPTLARTGLKRRFDAIVTADDVRRPKPAPDVYLEACARLALPPALTVAVEDSPRGVEAARKAGLVVVAVGCSANGGLGADTSVERLDDPALATFLLGAARP